MHVPDDLASDCSMNSIELGRTISCVWRSPGISDGRARDELEILAGWTLFEVPRFDDEKTELISGGEEEAEREREREGEERRPGLYVQGASSVSMIQNSASPRLNSFSFLEKNGLLKIDKKGLEKIISKI